MSAYLSYVRPYCFSRATGITRSVSMLPSAPLFVRPANGGRLPKLSPYLQSHYEEALGLSLTTTRLRSDLHVMPFSNTTALRLCFA